MFFNFVSPQRFCPFRSSSLICVSYCFCCLWACIFYPCVVYIRLILSTDVWATVCFWRNEYMFAMYIAVLMKRTIAPKNWFAPFHVIFVFCCCCCCPCMLSICAYTICLRGFRLQILYICWRGSSVLFTIFYWLRCAILACDLLCAIAKRKKWTVKYRKKHQKNNSTKNEWDVKGWIAKCVLSSIMYKL